MNSPRNILASTGRVYNIVEERKDISLSELRRKCFTSTNFPKLIGLHPFRDKRDLFLAKTGNHFSTANADKNRGIRLESKAIAKLRRKLRFPVFHLNKFYRHPRFHFFIASPDGVTARGSLVEVKCPRKRAFWIPAHHEAQMRWDMWVLDAPSALYVQLVDDEIFVEKIERDDKLVLDHLAQCIEFREMVASINNES